MTCHSSLRRAAARVWVLAALCVPAASHAEPGVTAQKIVLGMSAPLSGPLATYGVGLEQGLRLGIGQVNASGGVGGREIELRVLDDAGQPQRTVSNTRALLDAGVLALTGYHGTGGVEAVLPVLDANAVPLVGVASSAEVLREPVRNWVFNLRAGAREEAAAMVTQLDAVGLSEIAVIAQDDALGSAGLEGIRVELARLAIGTTAVARIPGDGSGAAVAKAVQAVCARRPQALVLVTDARNALGVIRQARRSQCMPQFYVMSEAGAQLLADPATARELAGVVVSQVAPHPTAANLPVVAEYRQLLAQAGGGAPSYPGVEGFLYARVIAEALRRCGREPTRRCLVSALEARPLEAGGWRVQFAPDNRRGSRFVEMTIVTPDGRVRR